MIIGITGGSGTGKSTVSKEFEKKGFLVIDADSVAHKIMDKGTPCLNEVVDFFGKEYLNPDETLNRKKLGQKVFSDKQALEELNKITYKYTVKEIELLANKSDKVIIDAILLIEGGLDKLCTKTIFVSCPKDTRIKRIVCRDNVSEDYAALRVDAQKDDEFYRQRCDFEIVNDGNTDVAEKIEEIIDCLKA